LPEYKARKELGQYLETNHGSNTLLATQFRQIECGGTRKCRKHGRQFRSVAVSPSFPFFPFLQFPSYHIKEILSGKPDFVFVAVHRVSLFPDITGLVPKPTGITAQPYHDRSFLSLPSGANLPGFAEPSHLLNRLLNPLTLPPFFGSSSLTTLIVCICCARNSCVPCLHIPISDSVHPSP
jgi:hypothetical protein